MSSRICKCGHSADVHVPFMKDEYMDACSECECIGFSLSDQD